MINLAKRWTIELLPPLLIRWLKYLPSKDLRDSDQKVRSDEYIGWLCQIVGGWLTPEHGNLRAFDYAIRNMPADGAILEIGSFLGLSTNIIAYLALKYNRNSPFFSCDPWVFEETKKPIGGYFDAGSQAFAQYAKEVFKQNITVYSSEHKPYAIEAFSEQFLENWHRADRVEDIFGRQITLGGAISFAYVDGAHTYEATKRDFLGIHQHLLPGGFILFDDSADGSGFGSVEVAHEVERVSDYELVFKTPHYFFRRIR